MNPPPEPVTEADLHAYADGQLNSIQRAHVEQWLAEHPDDAERVQAWRQIGLRLRAALDPIAREPIPPALVFAARGHRARRPWQSAALAASFALVGIGVGWIAHAWLDHAREAPTAVLTQRAAVAHAVYVPEVRHPVEVGADQEAHLVAWLSKRVGEPLKAPSLQSAGYTLVGGRLLPSDDGAVALFMYQAPDGKRLTLYVVRKSKALNESAFRFSQVGRVGVFYWVDDRCAYAISGELDRAALGNIAQLAYRELEPPGQEKQAGDGA